LEPVGRLLGVLIFQAQQPAGHEIGLTRRFRWPALGGRAGGGDLVKPIRDLFQQALVGRFLLFAQALLLALLPFLEGQVLVGGLRWRDLGRARRVEPVRDHAWLGGRFFTRFLVRLIVRRVEPVQVLFVRIVGNAGAGALLKGAQPVIAGGRAWFTRRGGLARWLALGRVVLFHVAHPVRQQAVIEKIRIVRHSSPVPCPARR